MNDQPSEKPFVYDEVPYPDALSLQSTPDQMAAAARMKGLVPPDPATASFLEIGCGAGINSIAIGAAAPGGRAVGFDLSEVQIAQGRRLASAAGLANVDLHHGDILTYPRDGEKFDYIVSHGVYTWVPEPVRAAYFELVAARLAPGGIAYVGYDAMPVSGVKKALNRWLVSSTSHIADPVQRVESALGLVAVLGRHQKKHSRFQTVIEHLLEDSPRYQRSYVFHDWLAEFYDPVSLPDLATAAARYGLAFAGNAPLTDLFVHDLDKDAVALVETCGEDLVARNVTLDLLRGIHAFRSDLFVRADAPPREEPGAWRALSFAFAGTREPDPDEGPSALKYTDGPNTGTFLDPASQGVLDCLIAHAPNEVSFAAIAAETGLPESELDNLLRSPVGAIVERHASPQPFVAMPGERPLASPLVRAQLAHNDATVGLRHKGLVLEDGKLRLLLVLSDGTRTRAEIAGQIAATFDVPVTLEELDRVIATVARRRVFLS